MTFLFTLFLLETFFLGPLKRKEKEIHMNVLIIPKVKVVRTLLMFIYERPSNLVKI